jgi:hypothetical protein
VIKKDHHTHKFRKEIVKLVPVRNSTGRMTAHDTIKLRKCKCGAELAYDMERATK